MSIGKHIRKNIYRWHRVTSLVIAVPVILWALSGCLHPIMNSFKPTVSNRTWPHQTINAKGAFISLKGALAQHQIEQIRRFRIVQLNDRHYYQVARDGIDTLTYISCDNGTLLPGADKMYAAAIAERYLNQPVNVSMENHDHHARSTGSRIALPIVHGNAQLGKEMPSVKSVKLVTAFNSVYKKSNVFLPVYRVSFNRSDSIALYVDPATDRLAYAADARSVWFANFFSLTHTWSFLDGLGKWKSFMLGCFSALCFLSSVFGFYVYNMTSKKKPGTSRVRNSNRYSHRVAGNFFLVTTLLFSLSGAWHSLMKSTTPSIGTSRAHGFIISYNELDFSLADVMRSLGKNETLCAVSALKIKENLYMQLTVSDGVEYRTRYIDKRTYEPLPDGDIRAGYLLATSFVGETEASVLSVREIDAFNHDYNMMYRRLPVMEVAFNNNTKYYVETSTGYLSAVTNASTRAERFSFSNLHMHHFWKTWFGKEVGEPVRNAVLVISTSGLLLLAFTGMFMYVNKLRQRIR